MAPVFEQYAVPITALVDAVHALDDARAVAGRDVVADGEARQPAGRDDIALEIGVGRETL